MSSAPYSQHPAFIIMQVILISHAPITLPFTHFNAFINYQIVNNGLESSGDAITFLISPNKEVELKQIVIISNLYPNG